MEMTFTMAEIREMTAAGVRKDFFNFICPCVYEVYRGDELLYVGRSKRGLSRVRERDRSMPNRTAAFQIGDRVQVTFYVTMDDAQRGEWLLISARRPKYNKAQIRYFGVESGPLKF